MTHLLDTNICSAHIKRPGGLAHRFFQYAGRLAVPTIVMAELYTGAHKHPKASRLLTGIADPLQEITILEFDLMCAEGVRAGQRRSAPQGYHRPSCGPADRIGRPRPRLDPRHPQLGGFPEHAQPVARRLADALTRSVVP